MPVVCTTFQEFGVWAGVRAGWAAANVSGPEDASVLAGYRSARGDALAALFDRCVIGLRLLVLTGFRLMEIQFLRWGYVGDDCIELPD